MKTQPDTPCACGAELRLVLRCIFCDQQRDEDRLRALKAAYELTPDCQTLTEAVDALVARVRKAEARAAELEQRYSGRGDELQDMAEFVDLLKQFQHHLRNCSEAEVQAVYDREKAAGNSYWMELTLKEAEKRGVKCIP